MTPNQIVVIISAWRSLYKTLNDTKDNLKYCQIFENKGELFDGELLTAGSAMGCSNPHPQYAMGGSIC